MTIINQKADSIGAISSALCLIHCIATPFIFIAQTSLSACCSATPSWWGFIDYLFLVISFFAVYHTSNATVSKWVKPSLWLSWGLLLFVIINEKVAWFSFSEYVIFIPTISLIILHLYNRKYCKCNVDKCCVHKG